MTGLQLGSDSEESVIETGFLTLDGSFFRYAVERNGSASEDLDSAAGRN